MMSFFSSADSCRSENFGMFWGPLNMAWAALVFLALQSANLLSLNWQPTYRVTALFDNIGGLKPKAAVRSAGVLVGRVADIRFDDEQRAYRHRARCEHEIGRAHV